LYACRIVRQESQPAGRQLKQAVNATTLGWTEAGLIPDKFVRAGIRRLLDARLKEIQAADVEAAAVLTNKFVEVMNVSPVALSPELANEQHYELPAEFFAAILGEHCKYSCCYWPKDAGDLNEAEQASLEITVRRAGIRDGMRVLDLGCGWGSLSLWMAEHFPGCQILAVSNSRNQHDFINARASERRLENLQVQVADMNDFEPEQKFDRIVSVEMFEHMRNYALLFQRIGSWMRDDARFFMHIFTHRSTPYEYADNGPGDWMSRHFFSGGIMPSTELPLRFAEHLAIEKSWRWGGAHYARTCNAWLDRMDLRRDKLMPILRATYGAPEAERWWIRWRMFFMACAELFDYHSGQEWFVSHYLFARSAH
jgi:cyclopropane-fatty-acyl-phospholipid synthase